MRVLTNPITLIVLIGVVLLSPASLLSQDQRLSDKLNEAKQRFELKDFVRTKELCEEILNDQAANDPPNNVVVAEAYNLLSKIYEHYRIKDSRHRTRVKSYLEDAVEKDPNNPEYRKRLAELYEEKDDEIADAMAQYEELVRLNAATQRILEKLKDYYVRNGDYNKAIPHYLRLVKLLPRDASLDYDLGVAYQQMGKNESAKTAFISATIIDPNLWQAHYALGLMYKAENARPEAKKSLQRVMEIMPGHLDAGALLVKLCIDEGDYAEAITQCDKILRRVPDDSRMQRLKNEARQKSESHRRFSDWMAVIRNALTAANAQVWRSGRDACIEVLAILPPDSIKKREQIQESKHLFEEYLIAHYEQTGDRRHSAEKYDSAIAAYDNALQLPMRATDRERIERKKWESQQKKAIRAASAGLQARTREELKNEHFEKADSILIAVLTIDPSRYLELRDAAQQIKTGMLFQEAEEASRKKDWLRLKIIAEEISRRSSENPKADSTKADSLRKEAELRLSVDVLLQRAEKAAREGKRVLAMNFYSEVLSLDSLQTTAADSLAKFQKERDQQQVQRGILLIIRIAGVALLAAFLGYWGLHLIRRVKRAIRTTSQLVFSVLLVMIVITVVGIIVFLYWDHIQNMNPNQRVVALFVVAATPVTLSLALMGSWIKQTEANVEVLNSMLTLLPEPSIENLPPMNLFHNPQAPHKIDQIEIRHAERVDLSDSKIAFANLPDELNKPHFSPKQSGDSFDVSIFPLRENGVVSLYQLRASRCFSLSFKRVGDDCILFFKNRGRDEGSIYMQIHNPVKLVSTLCLVSDSRTANPYEISEGNEGQVTEELGGETSEIQIVNNIQHCEIIFRGVLNNTNEFAEPLLTLQDSVPVQISTIDNRESKIDFAHTYCEVESGTIEFPKTKKEPIVLNESIKYFSAAPNSFKKLRILIHPKELLKFQFEGDLNSLRVAPTQKNLDDSPERLDNMLNWLRREHQIPVIIGSVLALLLGLLLDYAGLNLFN